MEGQQKFRHIYIEKRVMDHPRTREILAHFPESRVILIDHYKAVFNRRGQSAALQHQSQNLILAAAKDTNVYPGAPVCQDFGNAHFYYTSCTMNCLYDCEYCYLKGMYPSGNLVIFVELEKIFAEVEALLSQFPVYLCISYDTDLLAMEDIAHYCTAWSEFAAQHENLTIEIRTKCGRTDLWDHLPQCERVIFAYTISPEPVILAYEHGTAKLDNRLEAAAEGIAHGFPVRLCFDPMIYVPGWEEIYHDMLAQTAKIVPLSRVRDFSVGSFRISESYLKNLRRQEPDSAVVQYPFTLDRGYYHYSQSLTERMERTLMEELSALAPGAAIFRWEESNG